MYEETPIEALIRRCRECSQNINEYFDEFRYKGEVESQEEITPEYLRDKALDLMLGELKELGLSFIDTGMLLDDPFLLEVMFRLREKFDGEAFYQFLKSLDDENYAALESTMESVESAEDYYLELVTYLHELLPADTGFEYLFRAIDYIQSDQNFTDHIGAIFNDIDTNVDSNKSLVTEENFDRYAAFLRNMDERAKVVRAIVDVVVKLELDVDVENLMQQVQQYDKDKLNPPEVLDKWVNHYSEDADFVKQHHEETPHHLEYYHAQSRGMRGFPSKETGIMILASLYLDGLTLEQIHQKLNDCFKSFVGMDDELQWLHEAADKILSVELEFPRGA